MAAVTLAVEGTSDVAVIRRVLEFCGHDFVVAHGLHGKNHLDRNIPGYNNAARFAPWLIVRDLDHDAPCPGILRARLLDAPAPQLLFRVCVRAVEAWLLSDPGHLSEFLRVHPKHIPASPDALPDPKRALVNLARRSRSKDIRADMAPPVGASGRTGPAYVSRLTEFAQTAWSIQEASTRSPSLNRSIARLRNWDPK